MAMQDPYEMLYCDETRCLVNTFEAGRDGQCPGCHEPGLPIPPRKQG